MNALKDIWIVVISDNKYRKEYTTGNKKIYFSLRMPVFMLFLFEAGSQDKVLPNLGMHINNLELLINYFSISI